MAIPIHVPSMITKPQEQYNFTVDNSNQPFTHPSLNRDDLSKPIPPVTTFYPLDFVSCPEPLPLTSLPAPVESTPFMFVENTIQLRCLRSTLSQVEEFAVDLEHHSYRTFQGFTCLMQISTREADYVIDVIKLRPHIGPFLGEFFLDPTKRKVMHGAVNDIKWLQQDFGIYVCNLFDTMHASRVMYLERNSLEFLLRHFCGVTANKQYQRSDWRLRPLPREMIKYAREDTHYLLYIHDSMRKILNSERAKFEFGFQDPLGEAYKRSYKLCLKLYEKELFEETSYLHLYGLTEVEELDKKQLAVVAGLFEWRDQVARQEDESVGYVLPNKVLLEIAMTIPLNVNELLDLAQHRPYVVRDADLINEIIWAAIYIHAHKFEDVADDLNRRVPVSVIVAKYKSHI